MALQNYKCLDVPHRSIGRLARVRAMERKRLYHREAAMVAVTDPNYQILAAMALCIKTFLLRCFMRSMKYSLPSRLSSTGLTPSVWQQTRVSWLVACSLVADHHHYFLHLLFLVFIINQVIIIIVKMRLSFRRLKPEV